MKRCSRLAINDEGFAFDPSTGDSYLLNHTGLFMLQALRDEDDVRDIALLVATEAA